MNENKKIYIKMYREKPIDYSTNPKMKIIYQEYSLDEGVKLLCDISDNITYIGYINNLDELKEKTDEMNTYNTNDVLYDFTKPDYYCITYNESYNGCFALKWDEALPLFWNESEGEDYLKSIIETDLRRLKTSDASELYFFTVPFANLPPFTEDQFFSKYTGGGIKPPMMYQLKSIDTIDIIHDVFRRITFEHISAYNVLCKVIPERKVISFWKGGVRLRLCRNAESNNMYFITEDDELKPLSCVPVRKFNLEDKQKNYDELCSIVSHTSITDLEEYFNTMKLAETIVKNDVKIYRSA